MSGMHAGWVQPGDGSPHLGHHDLDRRAAEARMMNRRGGGHPGMPNSLLAGFALASLLINNHKWISTQGYVSRFTASSQINGTHRRSLDYAPFHHWCEDATMPHHCLHCSQPWAPSGRSLQE